jgi:hypothetical protein
LCQKLLHFKEKSALGRGVQLQPQWIDHRTLP